MTPTFRRRRSLLYVPGDKEAMLVKAPQRGADGLILNLEDAVAADAKDAARTTVTRALTEIDFGPAEVIVRTNPLDTDAGFRDLLAVMEAESSHLPHAILLPKVGSAEEVRFAAWTIDRLEIMSGRQVGSTALMCMIESAAGVLAAPDIAKAPRVSALLFGANDFCENVGCIPGPDQRALLVPSSRIVFSAAAAGIDAVDSPFMALRDEEGLRRAAGMARELGFAGKTAIHPAQLGPLNEAFSPTAEQIEWAHRVTEALATADPAQAGAAVLDGQLVETPHLLRARRILALAG